jgi:CTP synthase
LHEAKFDEAVLNALEIKNGFRKDADKELKKWIEQTSVSEGKKPLVIGIAGKYTGSADTYISILKALEHCSFAIDRKIEVKWIETTEIENGKKKVEEAFQGIDGLIVPGGFGVRGVEGKITCIKYCREKNIPFLGLCYGFQLALIEFARNVLGLKEANSTEWQPKCDCPVIDILPEQKKIEGLGANMRLGGKDVELKQGTIAFNIHGKKKTIRRRFRHRFECNPQFIEQFEKAGIVFSGKAPQYPIMQILEMPSRKFFMATQFHPEFTSRPLHPDEIFLEFAKSCAREK